MKKIFITVLLASAVGFTALAVNGTFGEDNTVYQDNKTSHKTHASATPNATAAPAEACAQDAEAQAAPSGKEATFPCGHKTISAPKGNKKYNVADIYDVAHVYRKNVNKNNTFFVVSKQEYRLYVYEVVGNDTLLAATYPLCYGTNTGGKTKTGDRCTPDCSLEKPFRISNIQNSSSWAHDFKDGRGSFLAYGAWFMRLDLSKSDCAAGCRNNKSIGLHGSTGNRRSVPGNDSEGCIRFRDEDIKEIKTLYAQVGTRVVVKPYTKGRYPFEVKAIKACKGYQPALQGYRIYE